VAPDLTSVHKNHFVRAGWITMCTNTTVNIFDGTIATWLDPFRKEILNADARIPMLDFCRSPGSTLNSMTKEPKKTLIYLTWATPLQCILDMAFNLDIYSEEQDWFKLYFVWCYLEKNDVIHIRSFTPSYHAPPKITVPKWDGSQSLKHGYTLSHHFHPLIYSWNADLQNKSNWLREAGWTGCHIYNAHETLHFNPFHLFLFYLVGNSAPPPRYHLLIRVGPLFFSLRGGGLGNFFGHQFFFLTLELCMIFWWTKFLYGSLSPIFLSCFCCARSARALLKKQNNGPSLNTWQKYFKRIFLCRIDTSI